MFLPVAEVFRNFSSYGGYKYSLSSPKLISTARDYFACSSLTSVEMENFQGEDETIPGSHWKGRIFAQELMSMSLRSRRPEETPHLSLSKFTLALFEDTGWYIPDYSAAEPMTFGYLAGCSFLKEQRCSSLAKHFRDYYCDGTFEQSCSTDGKSEVLCHKEELPGGSFPAKLDTSGNPYSDFCSIMGPSKTDCSSKLAGRLSLFSDVSARCVRLVSETNQDSTCKLSEYGLCDIVTCKPTYYYMLDFHLTCTYDNEIVKTKYNGSCHAQLKCAPCSEVCDDCSLFPKEKPIMPETGPIVATFAFSLQGPVFPIFLSTFFTLLNEFA